MSQIADFTALPVSIQTKLLPPATHYIYAREWTPKQASPDASRGLFLVNIPVTTTSSDIKHLLSTQLDGGHITSIHFARDNGDGTDLIANPVQVTPSEGSKKRKRDADEIPALEQTLSQIRMPGPAPRVHRSGASAVVIFVDRTARDLTLRNARRRARKNKPLVWGESVQGLERYKVAKSEIFPGRAKLLGAADEFMEVYARLEAARSRENARRRAVDEDGFVTVTRGSRGLAGAVVTEPKKKKSEGLDDFYRFQVRDRRRDGGDQLKKRFGEDRQRVKEMMELRQR